MIESPKISAAVIVAVVALSCMVSAGPTDRKKPEESECACAAMNSTDTSDLKAEKSLKVELPCDKDGEQQCNKLCIALANSTKADPDGNDKFCDVFGKEGLVNVHVFSKLCNRSYIFTGIIGEKPVCCKDKKAVLCP